MAAAAIDKVELRLKRFDWELKLHPTEESHPFVHIWLSTNVSTQVHTLELRNRAAGTSSETAVLEFPLVTPCADEAQLDSLLVGCSLCVMFFVYTHNSYREVVMNLAGVSALKLQALLDAADADAAAATKHLVVLYPVHDPRKNVKGWYRIGIERVDERGEHLISAEQYLVQRPRRQSEREQQDRWRAQVQKVCAAYVQAIECNNERIEPTTESARYIESTIWEHSAGLCDPLAYTVDVCRPQISDAYLRNLVAIVLRRMQLTDEAALALSDTSDELALLAGQVLCVPITHTVYRSDFVYVYDETIDKVEKTDVENFGDVSIDHGAGDCEDLARFILRHFDAFLRVEKTHPDALVRKLASYLRCFMPLLVLMGVSSAEINKPADSIKDMGAHEAAMLVPTAPFIELWARTDRAAAERFRESLWKHRPEERAYWERSAKMQVLVLEGTGVLVPISSVERWRDLRIELERDMIDNDVFFSMRRVFHYDRDWTPERGAEGSSFYKLVVRVFCGRFLSNWGLSFGSYVVIDSRTDTKGVTFTDFVSMAPHVSLRMLFPWTSEERTATLAMLRDLHPPPPLDVPSPTPPADSVWADAERNFRTYLAPLASFRAKAAAAAADRPRLVYYLRSSKLCDVKCAEALRKFFLGLEQEGRLRAVEVLDERISDITGGWQLVLVLE
jgi:hypothetical protein